MYYALAIGVLALHLLWIGWVITGALLTRGRRVLTGVHVLSLLYSIVIETAPWPCPLTLLEQWAQQRAGMVPYQGDFLTHYLGAIIYPDVPYWVLVPVAVAVCALNLGIYGWRWRRERTRRRAGNTPERSFRN